MPDQAKKQDEKARAEADRIAVDTPTAGTHATAAQAMVPLREDFNDTPPHILEGGNTDTFPTGNPALAAATFAENQDARAAAGKGKPFPRKPEELASHRAGVTLENEAKAVRAPTKEDEEEAKRLADAAKRDQLARIADAADVLNVAAGRR